MKYQSVRRLLGAVTLLVTGIGVAPGVLADGAAIISHPPATTPGLLTVTDGSTASLNEARAPVTSDVGYTAVTSAEADTTSGVLGGYAGFELEADATTVQTVIGTPEDPAVSEPKIGDTLAVSHATSVLSLQATVGGDPGASGLVTVLLQMHGSFLATQGVPTLELLGSLGAGRVNPASPLDFQVFSAALSIFTNALDPGVVKADFESSVSGAGGTTVHPGAAFELVSLSPANLKAVMALSFVATAGDQLVFSVGMAGLAAPEFDPEDADLSGLYDVDGIVLFPDFVFDDGLIDVFASAGATDFANTGVLSIRLAPGLTLEGVDPLLANVVTTVPLPGALWLCLSVVPLLGWRRRS